MKAFRFTYLASAVLILAVVLGGCGGGTPEGASRLSVATSSDDSNFTNVIASGYIVANDASVITAPAGVGTATPAFWVDNLGTANDALVISKSATPIFKVGNSGAVTLSGNQSLTGGLTVNNWVKVAAPTAVTTATPAAVIDNAGAGNVLLDVRKQATPVFTVGNIGSVSGLSLDTSSFVSVGSFLALEAATPVPVIEGATITPLGSMQPITSTAAVTTSTSTAVANGGRVGDLLILRNDNASDAITIDGTGANVECGGNKALGAKDNITLVWNGSDWVCIAYQNN